jgi:hypothetical protein
MLGREHPTSPSDRRCLFGGRSGSPHPSIAGTQKREGPPEGGPSLG